MTIKKKNLFFFFIFSFEQDERYTYQTFNDKFVDRTTHRQTIKKKQQPNKQGANLLSPIQRNKNKHTGTKRKKKRE